jgi:hypothetical protein
MTGAVEEARRRLRAAHASRAEVQRALDTAGAAAERARQFAIGVRDETDALREVDRGVAVDRSLAIKAAILGGEVPSFEPVPKLAEHAAALAEAESRLRSAEVARAHIEAAEGDAVRALTAAEDAVREAAETLMLAEANSLAEEIEALDAKALALRVRLGGGQFAPIAVRGRSLTPALARVLTTTSQLSEGAIGWEFAGRLYHPMRAAGQAWLSHIDRLLVDADDELSFDEPSPAVEEAKAA